MCILGNENENAVTKFEEIDLEIYNRIDWAAMDSEMHDRERRFVHGLIRHYKPKRLLELGVARGGGSANILNAISDDSGAKLISIDRLEKYYGDRNMPVGCKVELLFPLLGESLRDKWTLLTGIDASETLETLSETFDFAVIDTAHLHPIESLNFLCALPYLSDSAIVVLHDISLFYIYPQRHSFATRILISALTGEKIFPEKKYSDIISKTELVNNICAVKITPELKKHITNVFIALSLPWETYPAADIANIRNLLEKHYSSGQLALFDEAERANLAWHFSKGTTYSLDSLTEEFKTPDSNIIFYGAGEQMGYLLRLYRHLGILFDYPIWDIKAETIKTLDGHRISLPDFETRVSGITAVITVGDLIASKQVQARLEALGYTVIRGGYIPAVRFG